MRSRIAALLAGSLLLCAPVLAHHSFTATYDENTTIKIEGELVQFMFRNPHAFVAVMAPDENGQMQRWGVEWGGAGSLAGQGVTRDTLKAGDRVIITGNPGRNAEDHRVRIAATAAVGRLRLGPERGDVRLGRQQASPTSAAAPPPRRLSTLGGARAIASDIARRAASASPQSPIFTHLPSSRSL